MKIYNGPINTNITKEDIEKVKKESEEIRKFMDKITKGMSRLTPEDLRIIIK